VKIADNVYCYPEGGMFDCNTYLIKDEKTIIIDAGSEQAINTKIAAMAKDGIKPEDIDIITITHLHPDHFWANSTLQQASGAEIIIHPLHRQYYDYLVHDVGSMFGMPDLDFKTDRYFENDELDTGSRTLKLIHAPGHSPESICFYDSVSGLLAVGDVIFDHNVGRSDLPAGNSSQLKESINKLSDLNAELLLPGHMGYVSGAENVKENFVYVRNNVFMFL
jgi:hydroxyacylglutathione hydrolase